MHTYDKYAEYGLVTLPHIPNLNASFTYFFKFIWTRDLATPDIGDVYVDIEDHDIDVFFDIEYSNLDIDVTVFDIVVTKKTSISTKRRYRRLELRYRVLKSLRYRSVGTSISV